MITTPTAFSAAPSSHAGSSDLSAISGSPTAEQHERVTEAPPGAESDRRAMVAILGSDQRGDRDEMVGIGGMAKAEHEREAERDQQRRAGEEARDPGVEVLERLEEEVEVHRSSPPGPTATATWP